MGRHMEELKPSEVVDTLRLTTIAQSFGILSAGLIKITLGAFLLRIIIKPWQRIAVWLPMVIVMFMSSLCVICLWLQKTPVESVYNPYITKFKTNLDQTKLSLVVSGKLQQSHVHLETTLIWNSNLDSYRLLLRSLPMGLHVEPSNEVQGESHYRRWTFLGRNRWSLRYRSHHQA